MHLELLVGLDSREVAEAGIQKQLSGTGRDWFGPQGVIGWAGCWEALGLAKARG